MTQDAARAGTGAREYLRRATAALDRACVAELPAICAAAEQVGERLAAGGMLHTFGTGHSHLLAEEVFYRAGGLARVNPILVEPLMLHVSASGSSRAERRPGLAGEILADHPIAPGDVLVVASNSGGNTVAIELAAAARASGTLVIALTSVAHATSPASRTEGAARLHDHADIVLDNHGTPGDACTPVPGTDLLVGATSTVVGAALLHALMSEVAFQLVGRGRDPEVFRSANTAGGDAHNEALLARYRHRVRAL